VQEKRINRMNAFNFLKSGRSQSSQSAYARLFQWTCNQTGVQPLPRHSPVTTPRAYIPTTPLRSDVSFNHEIRTKNSEEQKEEAVKDAKTQAELEAEAMVKFSRMAHTNGMPPNIHEVPCQIKQIRPRRRQQRASGIRDTRAWVLSWNFFQEQQTTPLELIYARRPSISPLEQIVLKFRTAEKAVAFAESNGWNYEVIEPKNYGLKSKDYSDTFFNSFIAAK